jgi:hypothetical protein
MENPGAARRLDSLFVSYARLGEEAPARERRDLRLAIDVTITAYKAAGLLANEEAVAWRRRLAELGQG